MSEGVARKARTRRFKGWLLRHRIDVTLNVYSHVLPNMQRAAFSRLDERLQKT